MRPVKRVSSIGGSHFRFAGHLLFLALLSPPCLSLRGEHAGTGHSGGKYSWRAGFGEFADYRTGNFNDPFSRRPTPRERRPLLDSPGIQTLRAPRPELWSAVRELLHESPEIVCRSLFRPRSPSPGYRLSILLRPIHPSQSPSPSFDWKSL